MATSAMELKVLISILQSGTALPNLLNQVKDLSKGLTNLQQQVNRSSTTPIIPKTPTGPIDEATDSFKRLDSTVQSLVSTMKFLAGGFLALKSVQFLKDLADTAARAQVLQTVLHVVGNNAGYTTTELNKADRQIQSLGITATAARQSLTQFIQAELDLADAPKLARAAQDAAVILGTNSSEAFERLVTAVQTSNTLMLRHMGITISAETAYQKYAQSIGKTVTQLSTQQRAQAFLNETLVATARIGGSYVAAMGDVGKQMSSLTRLTEQLQKTLGDNLLPAYLAIVQELTLFLEHMQLVADETYGQGQGAKKLGEAIATVATAIRETIEFIVDYRVEIGTVIGLWLAFSKVIIPVVGLLTRLQTAFAALSEGGALVGLIGGLSLLGGGLIALGLIIVGFQLYSTRFNAAIQVVFGVIGVFVESVVGLAVSLRASITAIFQTIYAMMEAPFSPSEWLKPWEEWATGVMGWIHQIKDLWDNTQASMEATKGLVPQGDDRLKLQVAHNKKVEEEKELLTDIAEKEREINKLRAPGSTASEEEIKNAMSARDVLKKKIADLREAGALERERLGYNAAMAKMEQENIATGAVARGEQRLTDKYNKATQGAAFIYRNGDEIGQQFDQRINKFTDLLEIYNMEGGQAKVQTEQLLQTFQESAGIVKTTGDLKALIKARDDLVAAKAPKSIISRANLAVSDASIQVREEREREGAKTAKESEARFSDTEKRITNNLDNQLRIMKTAHGIQEAEEQRSYARRGLSIDDYYTNRRNRLLEENAKESQIAENAVNSLVRKRSFVRTPQERAVLETQIVEARAALDRLRGSEGENAARLTKLAAEEEDAREDKLRKSQQTLLDIQATYGDQDDILAAINFKHQHALDLANTDEEKQALIAQHKIDVFDAEAKGRERLLQLSLRDTKQLQDSLEAEQQRLQIATQHVNSLEGQGQITEVEAMRERNAIRRLELTNNEVLLATKKTELEKLTNALLEDELAIKQELADQSDDIINARLDKDLGQRRQEVQRLGTEVETLTQKIGDSAGEVESYGKKLKDSFTNSFSDAIVQTTDDFRKAGDVWVSMAQTIRRQIISVFAKNVTQKLFERFNPLGFMDSFLKTGPSATAGGVGGAGNVSPEGLHPGVVFAEGGMVSGPGTGTSDSIPAMVSAGEHIMPASKAATWMPLLEGIRTGRILPFASGGIVQPIAGGSVIPRRYAEGGAVATDGGASAVSVGGPSSINVSLDRHTLNMTMEQWLERTVISQNARR